MITDSMNEIECSEYARKRRRDLQDYLAAEIMRFEKDTQLKVLDLNFTREDPNISVWDENGLRPGFSKNVFVQVQVPMRV